MFNKFLFAQRKPTSHPRKIRTSRNIGMSLAIVGCIALGLGFSQNLHPGFDLVNLRPGVGTPSEFKPVGIGGMAFLPSGDLAICTWGGSQRSEGELWRLSGVVDAKNPSGVVPVKLAEGFREPLGLRLVDGTLYLLQKNQLTRVVDDTKTGNYTGKVTLQNVYDKWDYEDGNHHDFSFGFLYKDSAFYFNTGIHPPRKNGPDRGALLKVDLKTKTHSHFAGGMRNANGMAFGPEGQFFSTDNQGQWLPANKLINQRFGRNYGHNKGDNAFQDQPESPPVVWMPKGESAFSPAEPLWLTFGQFTGQFIYGDVRLGAIRRIFVERVKGEYQGVVFPFIEGAALEAGPNRLEYGPDSSIYIGAAGGGTQNLGGAGNWSWNNKFTGLQKIKENGKVAFEMKAIRAKATGFEIEFTQPAAATAGNKANYKIDRWGFKPQAAYGAGNKEFPTTPAVQNATLSPDGRFVTLELAPADMAHHPQLSMKSTFFRFTLSNINAASSGTPILHNLAWYTLNNHGPADFLGCMDKNNPAFNAQAVYDDGLQCNKSGTARIAARTEAGLPGVTFQQGRVHINVLGDHQVSLVAPDGQVLSTVKLSGVSNYLLPSSLKRGVYAVVIKTPVGTLNRVHLVL